MPGHEGGGEVAMEGRLTPDELESFTEYKRGAEQLDFLQKLGIRTIIGRNGHPVVTWEAIHRVLANQQTEGDAPLARRTRWDKLNKAA